jgi:hypothetical protein
MVVVETAHPYAVKVSQTLDGYGEGQVARILVD